MKQLVTTVIMRAQLRPFQKNQNIQYHTIFIKRTNPTSLMELH